jgi:hypothetical protein
MGYSKTNTNDRLPLFRQPQSFARGSPGGCQESVKEMSVKGVVRLPDTKSQQLAAGPGTAVEPAFWSEVIRVESPC